MSHKLHKREVIRANGRPSIVLIRSQIHGLCSPPPKYWSKVKSRDLVAAALLVFLLSHQQLIFPATSSDICRRARHFYLPPQKCPNPCRFKCPFKFNAPLPKCPNLNVYCLLLVTGFSRSQNRCKYRTCHTHYRCRMCKC